MLSVRKREKPARNDPIGREILNKKQDRFLSKTNNSSNFIFFLFSLDFSTPFAYNTDFDGTVFHSHPHGKTRWGPGLRLAKPRMEPFFRPHRLCGGRRCAKAVKTVVLTKNR